MPWKPAALSEVDKLKTVIVCLKRELENKQGAVGRLEVLTRERSERIDQLQGTVDQLRLQNRLLGQENGHLAAMLAPK
jgi:predicted RNase H-like nuclease (RuvC/YqgF family)